MEKAYFFMMFCSFFCGANFATCIYQYSVDGDAKIINKAGLIAGVITLFLFSGNILQSLSR